MLTQVSPHLFQKLPINRVHKPLNQRTFLLNIRIVKRNVLTIINQRIVYLLELTLAPRSHLANYYKLASITALSQISPKSSFLTPLLITRTQTQLLLLQPLLFIQLLLQTPQLHQHLPHPVPLLCRGKEALRSYFVSKYSKFLLAPLQAILFIKNHYPFPVLKDVSLILLKLVL